MFILSNTVECWVSLEAFFVFVLSSGGGDIAQQTSRVGIESHWTVESQWNTRDETVSIGGWQVHVASAAGRFQGVCEYI